MNDDKTAFPRASGILLHPTSLQGPYGIGDLGPEAHRFCEFLVQAGQSIWQMLPLGPTGYGESPYQCFSAFAGNHLLISLDELARAGYLDASALKSAPRFPNDTVAYEQVVPFKESLLRSAAQKFAVTDPPAAFARFVHANAAWLDDFSLFMALKKAHGGSVWTNWEQSARDRTDLEHWRKELRQEVFAQQFYQWQFFEQWNALKSRANAAGIRVIGDLPIYVAHDSADVWAHRELFQLEETGEPKVVAGVPPDYFSATGQRWGNPIYDWKRLAAGGFGWWIERFRATFHLFDAIRLDHFRGFEAYWQSPANEDTAANGAWIKGPGASLFAAVEQALGKLPIIAENLGVITPEVEAIRERFGFPGMAILQFAFGNDPQGPDFKPHNYPRNRVAYTGTHDNDTVIGWWNSQAGAGSIRTADDIEKEHAFVREYLNTDGHEVNWDFIRALMASVADTVIFPLQDVLGLGSTARMNTPATASGNWRWRLDAVLLKPEHANRLRRMAEVYDRIPQKSSVMR